MNEQTEFERLVADQLASVGTGTPPESAITETIARARGTRRLPGWLALIKEPPMRTNSHLAVGSPTVRIMAIMAVTMLLALALAAAGAGAQRLLAADRPIVVAQDGSGDHTTIAEAVAAAVDGDEILVRPGRYAESIVIDKDVHLYGEDRDRVVIEYGRGCTSVDDIFATPPACPDGTPMWEGPATYPVPYGIILDGTAAEVSDLTFEPEVNSVGIVARGGSPLIHHVTMLDGGFVAHDGSMAVISESDLSDSWVFFEEQSPATIERSSFYAIVANSNNTYPNGGPSFITDNRTHGIMFGGSAVIERNIVTAPEGEVTTDSQYGQGIDVQSGDGWSIAENTVSGFSDAAAINVVTRSTGAISDNTLEGNRVGIFLGLGKSEVRGNTIRGGETGITIVTGEAELTDNVIENNSGRGISIGGTATPSLGSNRSCGNGTDLWVGELADPSIDDSNEFCGETAAE